MQPMWVGSQGTPWNSFGEQPPEWAAKGVTSDKSDHSPAGRDRPPRIIASSLLKDKEHCLDVSPFHTAFSSLRLQSLQGAWRPVWPFWSGSAQGQRGRGRVCDVCASGSRPVSSLSFHPLLLSDDSGDICSCFLCFLFWQENAEVSSKSWGDAYLAHAIQS